MRIILMSLFLTLSLFVSGQQKADGIFIKFSSKNIKFASRLCTIQASDTGQSIHSQSIQVPNNSSFYFLRCNPNVPVRIFQDDCLLVNEGPFPIAEIKVDRPIYSGDSILVDMDKGTRILINKKKL